MNSGNYRMDMMIEPGPVTFGVIENIITDTVIVLVVPAVVLLEALEVSVSMYPNMAGRYSTFSGVSFAWDASLAPMGRIDRETIRVHDEAIDMGREYTLAVHSFVGAGGDGFECLKACKRRSTESDG